MTYTVLVPALNEEQGIADVVRRLSVLLPKPEIIVIDDGSTDKTGDIARSSGAKVIVHPMSGGYGRSLKDGILAAANDVIVITDADGTYPIERIPDLLKEFAKGSDMVVGARQGKHYRGTFLKMPARIVFKWLVEFTTGRRIPDINSGLRVFRKSQVLPYMNDLCNGFSFTTTITLIYCLTGKFVQYVPIDYAKRSGVSKVRIVRDSIRTLQYVTEVIAVYNPLKLFVLLAGILGFFAAFSCIEFFIFAEPVFLFFASIFLIGSFILFGMGVQAHVATRSVRASF